jgi:hypothetical protein
MNTSDCTHCAFVALPFLGEAWAKRTTTTAGRSFLDTAPQEPRWDRPTGLVLFVGRWSLMADPAQTMPAALRPAWVFLAAPVLILVAVVGALVERALDPLQPGRLFLARPRVRPRIGNSAPSRTSS